MTENTRSWEETKLTAKRLFDSQLMGDFSNGYKAITEGRKFLDIASSSPMPFVERARVLADELERLVRKRVHKMPEYEVELLDSVITLLRSVGREHGNFITRLVGGYERQYEYYLGHAKARGEAVKSLGESCGTLEWAIMHLIESNEHKK